MRILFRTCSSVAIAGFAFLELSSTGVQAQGASACVQSCRTGGWSYNQCTRYCQTTIAADARPAVRSGAPRVYGYSPRVYGYYGGQGGNYGYYRAQSGNCGQYRYLKGGQCVDARVDPPILR